MTVREFMKMANSGTLIDIRSPVYDETGSLIRYESIQKKNPVEWPNIKGIDASILDRKIQGWSLESCDSGVPFIRFDTVKGE